MGIITNAKKVFNWAYLRLFYDRSLVHLLSEYFNLAEKEVLWLLKNGGRINNDFWRISNPKTDEEKKHFYEITLFYIFELSLWHMTMYQKKFRKEVLKIAQGKVLDFGGGIGDMSLMIAKKGVLVEYADVSGNTYNFAKWLFSKNNLSVKMIDLSTQKVSEQYDTIVCIDVIEHLLNAKEVFKDLALRLKPGGKFVVTNLVVEEESLHNHPMHEKINLNADDYLKSLHLFKTEKPWLLIKK